MITAELYSVCGSGDPAGFRVSGHTGISGQSVVCAAVSSACYMAANTITEIIGAHADISEDDGYMSVIVNNNDIPETKMVLAGLQLHLEQLAEQYPKQIKLKFTEVHQ